MTAAWKKLCFILSVRSDFHMIDSLLIAIHAFVSHMSMSFSVDETLLPRQVNLSTSFREVPSSVEMLPASRCALMKFSYSSFGVPFSVFSCNVLNLFLNSNTYLSLISLLLRRAQSYWTPGKILMQFFYLPLKSLKQTTISPEPYCCMMYISDNLNFQTSKENQNKLS